MKKDIFIAIAFILFIIFSISVAAQEKTALRVFLIDKGPEIFQPGSEIYNNTLNELTEKCLQRRSKVLNQGDLISIKDAPVYNPYIDSLLKYGAEIKAVSKWNNYVTIICPIEYEKKIKSFTFIDTVMSAYSRIKINHIDKLKPVNNPIDEIFISGNCGAYRYGKSFQQLLSLNIPKMHRMGFSGKDITIGFTDSGFRNDSLSSLRHIPILGEYDFVYRDSNTANEYYDHHQQDHHGTIILSAAAGFFQDSLIGIAPGINAILAKTENLNSETHLEEDYLINAVEWIESLGGDIVNTSLGYADFDQTDQLYDYSDLTGSKLIVSKTFNRAVGLGIVSFVSMGNSGPDAPTVQIPASSDSTIAVGAVMPDNITPAKFTSRGPRYDGKILPDISAFGFKAVTVNPVEDSSFVLASGTSISSPFLAASAALLLEAFPELKPYEIRNLLIKNANNYLTPDNNIGYGVPDIYKAMLDAGTIISPPVIYNIGNYVRIGAFIISKFPLNEIYLNIALPENQPPFLMEETYLENFYRADIPIEYFEGSPAQAAIYAGLLPNERRYPYDEDKYFIVEPGEMNIPCGVDFDKLPKVAPGKSKLLVFPSVVTGSHEKIRVVIDHTSFVEQINSIGYYDVNISVYDLTGKRILSKKISRKMGGIIEFDIDVSYYNSGVYVLMIQTGEQNLREKFVKIR